MTEDTGTAVGDAIQAYRTHEEAEAAACVARENGWPEAKAVVLLYLPGGSEAYSGAWVVRLTPESEPERYLCVDGEARP
ncbi:MAG: hypothetical protein F4X54_07355 [Chloroflexi bacterium]|nr:hypothetical protein [Chloroflexota bacterium]MYB84534.1 hypothetical protein [Chloroflexota bacterium]